VSAVARPEHWQVQESEAQLYERHLVPAVTAPWAADLVERAGVHRDDRVLDVACGTGIVARTAQERVGSEGSVTGLDINPAMLAVAQSQSAEVQFIRGSALALPFDDGSFDAVLCQFGLQFFPNRAAALGEMHRVLTEGGRLGASVYGPIEENPGTLALAQALDHHLGTGASQTKRAEHVLAYPSLVEKLAVDAGFADITLTTETKVVRFSSAPEWVNVQLTATPLASLLAERLSRPGMTERITASVVEALQRYEVPGGIEFPVEAHVLVAHA
jgi:ubiquinone/menaquinone biosynthesis C-methylase UbiE